VIVDMRNFLQQVVLAFHTNAMETAFVVVHQVMYAYVMQDLVVVIVGNARVHKAHRG
jgi:ABC-type taurine transport system ATPase subunit